jgi:hypothetical protein
MPRAKGKDRPLRKGDKVVATVDLPGVPEGTTGKVKLSNGLFRPGSWMRYWVFFGNGVQLGSIGGDKLVQADRWEDYKVERVRRAEEGAAEAARSAERKASAADGDGGGGSADGDGGGDGAASSRVPAHLLERSKARRQALGLG